MFTFYIPARYKNSSVTFSRESFLKHELILHNIQNLFINFRNLGCIYSILPQRTMLRLTTAKAYQMEL